MHAEIDFLLADDGHRIARYRWRHPQPRGLLLLSHGMAEHAGRYARLTAAMQQRGIEVWALDHRGHGLSVHDGRFGHYADQQGWTKAQADLHMLVHAARQQHPKLPLSLLGHSMGSYIARAYALQHGRLLDGLILSAPGFRQSWMAAALARLACWQGGRSGWDRPSRLLGRLVFGSFNLRFLPSRTAFDWLSRDAAEVDAYLADPHCGFDCSPSLWRDLLLAIVAMEQLERHIPAGQVPRGTLLLAGSHDPVSLGGLGCRQLARRYQAAGWPNVTVRIYPQGRHELLHELNAAQLIQDLADWLPVR